MSAIAELCGGPVGLLDGRLALADAGPLLQLELPPPALAAGFNTLLLRFDEAPRPFRVRTADGATVAAGTTHTRACFGAFAAAMPAAERLGVPSAEAELLLQAPLLYASPAGGADRVHLYSQVRLSADDALFVRTSEQPVPRAGWVAAALERHAAEATFLGNHQCYYRRCFAGQEIEHKLTLDPDTDVWELTARLYAALASGELPGFVMEYGDEFQRWDYENHLFEVLAPDAERGYISFIPTTDGRFTVKRKWYREDALVRREQLERGVHVAGGDFERHLRERFAVTVRRLPSFRRVRYDVNVESLQTGHVYGAFFDCCSLPAAPHVMLSQCEVEYLRSRVAVTPDEDAVLPELERFADWVTDFLRAREVGFERSHYSKLSFLRDAVARDPRLAEAAR